MKFVKKYVPCKAGYMLKIYAFMMAFLCALVYFESCPMRPFSEIIGKAMLGTTVAFLIVSPLLGFIFTQKSLNTCKFHLPYQHIDSIHVDERLGRLTLIYHYHPGLSRKSKKERRYTIDVDNYQTTLEELLGLFPENINRIYG